MCTAPPPLLLCPPLLQDTLLVEPLPLLKLLNELLKVEVNLPGGLVLETLGGEGGGGREVRER